MKQCENCGKKHDGSFASGRFCSKHCSRSFATKNMGEESKRRKSENVSKALRKAYAEGRRIGWNLSEEAREKSKEAYMAYLKTDVGKEHIKKLIKESQTEEAIRKRAKSLSDNIENKKLNGEKWGWEFSRRNCESYPESVWRKVLEDNNIEFTQEYKVLHRDIGLESKSFYFLDFLLFDRIDLEIDGSQHLRQVEHDAIRDKALTKNGYVVYRIPWVNPANNKLVFEKQVDDLLLEISSFSL